jgi:hypothetical protein
LKIPFKVPPKCLAFELSWHANDIDMKDVYTQLQCFGAEWNHKGFVSAKRWKFIDMSKN